ncbi:MAG: S1-C subfamily serine protease [Verrucomicrobiales bacterium]|jgi:S1-C subfamily serine protease
MIRLLLLAILAVPSVLAAQLTEHEQRVIATFKETAPSVVHITTLAAVSERITLKHGDIPNGVKRGVLILEVTPGMGADKAKLLPTRRKLAGRVALGDAIVAIDRKTVNEPRELTASLNQRKPGDTVALTILRDGKEKVVTVQLLEGIGR